MRTVWRGRTKNCCTTLVPFQSGVDVSEKSAATPGVSEKSAATPGLRNLFQSTDRRAPTGIGQLLGIEFDTPFSDWSEYLRSRAGQITFLFVWVRLILV
jgi:hypothetical protein